MKNKLDRIEAKLRNLFEERLIKFFSGKESQLTWVDDLIRLMKENLEENPEGLFSAPDKYILKINPKDFFVWQTHQDILDELASFLHKTGMEEGFIFQEFPIITLLSDPNTITNEMVISATVTPPKPSLPDTAAVNPVVTENDQKVLPDNAFLIVDGKNNYPLIKNVVNIGRHSDNDLLIDDPHVSRHHAQLRWINRRFVLFDAGSSSGLFVNGKKITQATLQAGDVIRLGVINLIYVQDTTGENPTTFLSIDSEEIDSGGSRR